MKRLLIRTASVTAGLLVIGTIAWWMFLAVWVPAHGKARLEAELERHFPIDVSLGAMRYEFFRGIVVEGVRVTDRASHESWGAAPAMRVHVGWLSVILQRELAFRVHAPLEVPCRTTLDIRGHYHLQRKSLTLEGETTDIALSTITGVLSRHVPHALTDGTIRLEFHLTKPFNQSSVVTGRLLGRRFLWTAPPLRVQADATIEGRAQSPLRQGGAWKVQALISLHDGAVEGLPFPSLQTITEVEGTAQLTEEALEIEQLNGTALGSRWVLEGTLSPLQQPSAEFLVSSQATLATLLAPLRTANEPWEVSGPADLRVVCRGPLHPTPRLDCLAHADLRDVTVTNQPRALSVTQMSGGLDYDVVSRRLAISHVTGRVLDQSLTLDGSIHLTAPLTGTLDIDGTLPLNIITGWLPPEGPIQDVGGLATLDVTLQGPLNALSPTGQITVRDAYVHGAAFANRIDHVTGLLLLQGTRLEVRDATLELNEEPMHLTAAVTLEPSPHFTAIAKFSRSQLSVTGQMTADDVAIEDARASLAHSDLRLRGAVGRGAERPSRLRLTGTVAMEDLSDLPLVRLPNLETWKLAGTASADVEFQGRLSDWRRGELRGEFRAERLSVRDVPVEQLMGEVEQQRSTLRVRVPSALVAGGRFQGGWTAEHGAATSDVLVQADLVGLQLERLAQVVPAWRKRAVTGTASAHAMVSGTWGQRATWRGEGWLNASGEHLGDVPLLDKVLRGLFGVLGERMGLESLRRARITQASLTWRLSQERLQTEDLRLGGLAGTEPVAIYATGSMGLDHTLDFVIEPELSEGIVLEAPTTSTLASTILKAAGQLERLRRLIGRHRLVGTLKNPEYRFEYGTGEVIKQVAPGPTDLLHGILDSLR